MELYHNMFYTYYVFILVSKRYKLRKNNPMPNLTLKIDDKLLKTARKIAIDKETTLTSLIREYLENLVQREQNSREDIIARLQECYSNHTGVIGEKNWTRENLHDR